MPISGGSSDKKGNVYELKWTMIQLLEVLDEKHDSITLEVAGEEGEGCEYKLVKDNRIEYHQVKRQNTKDDWNFSRLKAKQIIKYAYIKTGKGKYYSFISQYSCGQLYDLIERANDSESYLSFIADYVKVSQEVISYWNHLISEWDNIEEKDNKLSDEEKYYKLQNIIIVTIDEVTLENRIRDKISLLIEGEVDDIYDKLLTYILDNTHKKIDTKNILNYLVSKNYLLTDYTRNNCILYKIKQNNEQYQDFFKPFKESLIIDRPIVKNVVDTLLSSDKKNSVLLTGEAGVGKTFVLGQIIEKLSKSPLLYFRIDQLSYTSTTKQLGIDLGFNESPIAILNKLSKGKPSFLIIDQLDEISIVSGRNLKFFDTIKRLLYEKEKYSNIRILIACRKFDLEKDSNFRELIGEKGFAVEKSVTKLSIKEVDYVLHEIGLSATSIQKEILLLPIHMKLFIDLVSENSFKNDWTSEMELFSEFWDSKKIKTQLGDNEWFRLLDQIIDKMSKNQQLSVSCLELEENGQVMNKLISENFLLKENNRVSFLHEKLYDYTAARRFIATGRDIYSFILTGGQNLFHRTLLRQTLLYLYSNNPQKYCNYLEMFIESSEVRFHIKKCVIDTLPQLNNIDKNMWSLLSKYLDYERLKPYFQRIFYYSYRSETSWFKYIFNNDILFKWITSGDQLLRDRGLSICQCQIEIYPDDVSNILNRLYCIGEEFYDFIASTLERSSRIAHRGIFDLFLDIYFINNELVRESVLFYNKSIPIEWKVDFFKLWIGKIELLLDGTDDKAILKPKNQALEKFLLDLVDEVDSTVILKIIFPFFLKIIKNNIVHNPDIHRSILLDHIWYYRIYGSQIYLSDTLLEMFLKCIETLCEDEQEKFLSLLKLNKLAVEDYRNYDTINFVLLNGIASVKNPSKPLVEEMVNYFIDNPERLESCWSSGGSEYWAGYLAVNNLVKFCSDEYYYKLEEVIKNHTPFIEKTTIGYKYKGSFLKVLLDALPNERITKEVRILKSKINEKYTYTVKEPEPMIFTEVKSPISNIATEKMTDIQWIKALKKYNRSIDASWKYNAFDVSAKFQNAVKRETERFTKLSLLFDENIHNYYFEAIFRGIRGNLDNHELVYDVIRHFFKTKKGIYLRFIGDALINFSKKDIPEDILQIVALCAIEHDDPKDDELKSRIMNEENPKENPHNYFSSSINSVRGCATDFISTLISDNKERIHFFLPYVDKIICDKNTSVRVSAIKLISAISDYDYNISLKLFLKICKDSDDVLLGTPYISDYLNDHLMKSSYKLYPIIKRMLMSSIVEAKRYAGQNIFLAYFRNKIQKTKKHSANNKVANIKIFLNDFFRYIIFTILYRQSCRIIEALHGMCEVANKNSMHSHPIIKNESRRLLQRAFNHKDKDIHKICTNVFWNIKGRDLEDCKSFIKHFTDSKAFSTGHENLFRTIKDSTADLTEEILYACEKLYSFENSYMDRNVGELILRVYRISDGDKKLENRCLDIVDNLLKHEEYSMIRELSNYER